MNTGRQIDALIARRAQLMTHARADVFDSGFIADGTRVVTASADGIIWSWDVHLETRTPDAIHRIISKDV